MASLLISRTWLSDDQQFNHCIVSHALCDHFFWYRPKTRLGSHTTGEGCWREVTSQTPCIALINISNCLYITACSLLEKQTYHLTCRERRLWKKSLFHMAWKKHLGSFFMTSRKLWPDFWPDFAGVKFPSERMMDRLSCPLLTFCCLFHTSKCVKPGNVGIIKMCNNFIFFTPISGPTCTFWRHC